MANYTIVLLEALRSFDQYYTYQSQTPLQIGDRVLVPFGPKDEPKEGVVFGLAEEMEGVKPVIQKLQARGLATPLIDSLRWAEDYYVAPIGALAKLALPKAVRYEPKLSFEIFDRTLNDVELSDIFELSLSGKQIQQLVDSGRIGRVYSAERKSLPTSRYLKLLSLQALESFQADLPSRQLILHLLIDQLLEQEVIPVAPNVTPRHIQALQEAGVAQLVYLPEEPQRNLDAQDLPVLTAQQQAIANHLLSGNHLIYGPPASGKTLMILTQVKKIIREGKQALILVPERLLAQQLYRLVTEQFSEPVALIHSQMSDGEIRQAYHFIASGDYSVIIGTRNAVLAPFQNLGLIAIDDFHDDAFYSDEPPVDFRRLALDYAKRLDIPLILASSTPDLIYLSDDAIQKHYLSSAYVDVVRTYHLIDMKTQIVGPQNGWLSRPLEQGVQAKSLLFLNRIGYASFVICRQCGTVCQCSQCLQPMVYHQSSRRLHCRLCGISQPLPNSCPHCETASFEMMGFGLEQLAEMLRQKYPDKIIHQFDSHSLRKKSALAKAEDWMNQADILLATQILTKGHVIENLEVVGLLSPDTMLYTPEYRGREKCFQTMIQVAGRVGRQVKGDVYIQTYSPENDVYQRAIQQDIQGFYRQEYQLRRMHGLPPHSHMIKLVVSDKEPQETQVYAEKLAKLLRQKFPYTVKGPYLPIFEKVSGYYRRQLLIQSTETMQDLKDFLRSVQPRRSTRLMVVVDPLTTLY